MTETQITNETLREEFEVREALEEMEGSYVERRRDAWSVIPRDEGDPS